MAVASAGGNRQKVELELAQLAKQNGLLRPEDVVKYASNPKTALHECFTWDDSEAAREYRLWQARQLIGMVVTKENDGLKGVRFYVSLNQDRLVKGGGYRAIRSVLGNAKLRQALLAEALADMKRFERKYESLKELAGVFAAMRAARQTM